MIIIFSNDIFGQQISSLQFWPGLPIIFHWKSPSPSAVERYFSVVRPFNQLRNRFSSDSKSGQNIFSVKVFAILPGARLPRHSLLLPLHPPQLFHAHHNAQVNTTSTNWPSLYFSILSILNSSPAYHLFYFSLQGASCAFWLPPELYISSGLPLVKKFWVG